MSWRVFLAGLLAWILLPVIAIGVACLWVGWQNGASQPGLLSAGVSPEVVYTGDDATLWFRFDGTALNTAKREPPLDIVFAIDTSQSVQNSIGQLSAAVLATARGLSRPGSDAPRFAVVAFSDQPQTLLDWSDDGNRLATALQGIVAGGGTVFTNAKDELDRLLGARSPRGGARTALVVYTDGEFQDWPQANAYAAQLRSRGIDLFVVGVPNVQLPAEVLEFVGDRPERMLETDSVSQLSDRFLRLKQQLVSGVGFDARLRVPLDGRHFAVGLQASGAWGSDGVAPVAYLGTLGKRQEQVQLPLRPLSFGLWRIGTAPARLTYADAGGRIQEALAMRPVILVLNVPFLLLAFLPVLLWILLYLRTRPRTIARAREPLPDVPPLSLTPELPAPGLPPLPRSDPVPTLMIGLGDAGGRCLQELDEHIARRGETRESLMLDGLWLHVAGAAKEVRTAYPALVPSLPVTHLDRIMSNPAPAHLAWFPQADYRNTARASLSVEHGCDGDRRLGRLALFAWLQEGDLESRLSAAVRVLLDRAPANAPRQVLVFGGAAGGFGGGALIDVCRLVRRAARAECTSEDAVPDVIAVLLGSDAIGRTGVVANVRAVLDELESARLERTFPVPTQYRANESVVDTHGLRAPFDQVFWIVGRGEQETAAQAAALASILTDARPRGDIMNQLGSADRPLFVGISAILLSLRQLHALVGAELFLRVIGPEVVADIEPSPEGGYQPRPASPGRAEALLHTLYANAEASAVGAWGRLWARLLGHAAGCAAPALSDEERASLPELTPGWLRRAVCCAVNGLLDGSDRPAEAAVKTPSTSEVAAMLHLLAQKIDMGADDAAAKAVVAEPRTLRDFAAEVAAAGGEIDKWIEVICTRAGATALARQEATQTLKPSSRRGIITRLEPDALDPQRLQEMVEEALQRWLPQAPSPAGSLREYLHFRLLSDSDRIIVELAGLPGVKAGAALDRLGSDAAALAQTVGPTDVLEHLAGLDGRVLEKVAATLKADRGTLSSRSFVVLPRHRADRDALVARLLDLVRERAGAGPQSTSQGDDRTAVSRLSILPSDPSLEAEADRALPYAQAAEVAGERMRRQMENVYERRVPVLPAPLRLALSQPEAFAAFARAFVAGEVVKRVDASGSLQWVDAGTGVSLTASPTPLLAEAAANFAFRWRPDEHRAVPTSDPIPTADDRFDALESWIQGGDDANGEALVLATIGCTVSVR